MTSLIAPYNIDITYPIAGQDNDTQGFRNNFQSTQDNFITAASEITNLQGNVSTLQTQVFGNANIAAYLPTYTGNISAGNLTVTSISYVNREIINTTDLVTGNLTVSGNIITQTIISPAGSNANIIVNPDGDGDIVFTAGTELWVNSTSANAIIVSGGMSVAGNITTSGNIVTSNTTINSGITTTTLTVSSAIQFANLTTTQVNAISTPQRGMTVYNYTTGNIQVYNGTKWANITLS